MQKRHAGCTYATIVALMVELKVGTFFQWRQSIWAGALPADIILLFSSISFF